MGFDLTKLASGMKATSVFGQKTLAESDYRLPEPWQLVSPTAIAVGPAGDVWIVASYCSRVTRMTKDAFMKAVVQEP
jgi:hypothetical protein